MASRDLILPYVSHPAGTSKHATRVAVKVDVCFVPPPDRREAGEHPSATRSTRSRGERPAEGGRDAQLRALNDGPLAKCRFRRNWYRFRMRPDASGCVPDACGCVGMRRDFEFQKIRRILAKFRQNLGNI